MGKRRAEIKKIPDPKLRYKAFIKRKRGLMKKAIELSTLCGVKIFLGLVNPDINSTSIYQSDSFSMRDIIKSLKDSNIKKEYINSDAYNSLLDPHYVKLLNSLHNGNVEANNNGSNKRDTYFHSVNDTSSQLFKTNLCSQINTETELNVDLSSLNKGGDCNKDLNSLTLLNADVADNNKEEKEGKSLEACAEHSLEELKNDFINESKDLNEVLKYQLSIIEEIGCYSDDLITELVNNSHRSITQNEIDFYKWLREYSNSFN